jgi:hypothetical protein
MNKQEHIDKMTNEALNSVDGANRAAPRPYLFTRLTARMQKPAESAWENAGRFIARPAVVIAGLCMVIAVNALVIVFNNSTSSGNIVAEQQATPDEFSNTVAAVYDIENNNEP